MLLYVCVYLLQILGVVMLGVNKMISSLFFYEFWGWSKLGSFTCG